MVCKLLGSQAKATLDSSSIMKNSNIAEKVGSVHKEVGIDDANEVDVKLGSPK